MTSFLIILGKQGAQRKNKKEIQATKIKCKSRNTWI